MSNHDTDDMKETESGADPLMAAIAADRQAGPAPGFSAAAQERVMMRAAARFGDRAGLQGGAPRAMTRRARIRALAQDLLRPALPAFAAAGVAGIAAGVVLTQMGLAATAPLTPEEQFVAYLDAGSGLDTLLEEDL